MKESRLTLPKTVELWTRPDVPQIVDAKNIFDYMDGAGELYLGYRFSHLEVYEYKAKSQKSIIVELYFMETSDDAFGLLSLDWEGESVDLSQPLKRQAGFLEPDRPRGLYSQGLIRLWSDNIYARVMAYLETPESKLAVLEISRAIVKGRRNPPGPELVNNLPDSFKPNWALRLDRASYFRSHLVLNSLYYLSHENILELDHSAEAVTAPYERKDSLGGKARIQLLLVKYSDHARASSALARFHRSYLPEHPLERKSGSSGGVLNTFPIEDGWLGYKLRDRIIAFIFECPDQETARVIIDQIS